MRALRRTVALASLVAALASCSVGEVGPLGGPLPGGGGDSPDASVPGPVDAGGGGGGGGGTPDAGTACVNKVNGVGDGHHRPGEDCQSGCHNHGFSFSGTIYAAAGGPAASGATIIVKDAAGTTLKVVSQANGNFYSSSPVRLPLTVTATQCPAVKPMNGQVQNGSCNQAGCHSAAGGAGRIHL